MASDGRPSGDDIIVPGSISNLGPAFDALAVAVELYLRVRIVERLPAAPDTLAFEFIGEPLVGANRIEQAFRYARERIGIPAPGLRLEVRSEIPIQAGLGSSGAATIAGLRLYERVTGPRPREKWLAMASVIEGHPDNAAAALCGGLTVSCQREDGRIMTRNWPWPPSITLIAATPDFRVETAQARRVLPDSVPLRDAIFNLQRSLLFVRALETGQHRDLREAMRDRWHQPFRQRLVPGLAEALALDHPAVLGACLSGSGPSVVILATDAVPEIVRLLEDIYSRLRLSCRVRMLAAHQPEDSAA